MGVSVGYFVSAINEDRSNGLTVFKFNRHNSKSFKFHKVPNATVVKEVTSWGFQPELKKIINSDVELEMDKEFNILSIKKANNSENTPSILNPLKTYEALDAYYGQQPADYVCPACNGTHISFSTGRSVQPCSDPICLSNQLTALFPRLNSETIVRLPEDTIPYFGCYQTIFSGSMKDFKRWARLVLAKFCIMTSNSPLGSTKIDFMSDINHRIFHDEYSINDIETSYSFNIIFYDSSPENYKNEEILNSLILHRYESNCGKTTWGSGVKPLLINIPGYGDSVFMNMLGRLENEGILKVV